MTRAKPRHTRSAWVATAAILAFAAAFFVWPLAHACKEAMWIDGRISADAFRSLATNPGLIGAILRSFQVAGLTTLVASMMALPAAFLIARHDFRGRRLWGIAVLVPLMLPPFVGAIGIKRLFGRYGTVNLLLMKLFGLETPPVDWLAADWISVVLLQALHLYPILYLTVQSSFRDLDPRLEEAAANLGCGPFAVFRRVALPLTLPAYFAGAIIVFVWAFTDVGTPLLLGMRNVVAVRIFEQVSDMAVNPAGHALVLVVVAISIAMFALARVIAPRHREVTASRGAAPRIPRRLGWAGTVAATGFLGGLSAMAIAPHIGVAILSFSERWFLTALPSEWSARSYRLLLEHPVAASSIELSILLAGAATVICVVLGLLIAHGSARGSLPLGRHLDTLAMAPLAVPGVVLAFGLAGAFAGTRLDPVTHSPVILLIASYAVRRLPFAVRAIAAGFAQVSPSLEEAARNLGCGPRRAFARITLPLLLPHILAGAVLTFVFAAVEVSDSLILAVKSKYYPMTKALWELLGRLDDGPTIASAMGVMIMLLLAAAFAAAAALLEHRGGGERAVTPATIPH